MAKRQEKEVKQARKLLVRHKQNRVKSQAQPISGSATRKTRLRSVPVTHRKTTRVQPVNRKRRKVSVPLKTRGAELQLPAFPQLQLAPDLWCYFRALIICDHQFFKLQHYRKSTLSSQKGTERLIAAEILGILTSDTTILKVQPDCWLFLSSLSQAFREVNVSAGCRQFQYRKFVERTPCFMAKTR